jgi:hypothetical protein
VRNTGIQQSIGSKDRQHICEGVEQDTYAPKEHDLGQDELGAIYELR